MRNRRLLQTRPWVEELEPRVVMTVYSTNWSGYAAETSLTTPAVNAVSDVSASWIVPPVATTNSGYSSFWVGIDGYSSSTVEQIGTDSDYVNGAEQYYAWYEMYPNPFVKITNDNSGGTNNGKPFVVAPNDAITASVHYNGSGGSFTLKITDGGYTFTTTQPSTTAKRSSAEWIAEAPSSISGVLPLANFGSVKFTGASATINGATGAIKDFPNTSIDMITPKGALKATTGPLNTAGDAFTVTWKSSGAKGGGRGGNGGFGPGSGGHHRQSDVAGLQDSNAAALSASDLARTTFANPILTPQNGPAFAAFNPLVNAPAFGARSTPAVTLLGAFGDGANDTVPAPRMDDAPDELMLAVPSMASSFTPAWRPNAFVFQADTPAQQAAPNRIVQLERRAEPVAAPSTPAVIELETQDSDTGAATSALGKILGLVAAALFFTQGAYFSKPQGVVEEEERERRPKL